MGKIFIFMYRLLFKSLRRKITSEVSIFTQYSTALTNFTVVNSEQRIGL